MKQHIKKIIEYLFGTKKNLTFKIGLASFMSSLIFIFLSDVFQKNTAIYSIFYSATVVCIILFILAIIKSTTATNIISIFRNVFLSGSNLTVYILVWIIYYSFKNSY